MGQLKLFIAALYAVGTAEGQAGSRPQRRRISSTYGRILFWCSFIRSDFQFFRI